MAEFIEHVQSPDWKRPAINAPEKITQNLFAFICSDPVVCPAFRPDTSGIAPPTAEPADYESLFIRRRGAILAFKALAARYGDKLWGATPVWEGFQIRGNDQKTIDALASIELVVPHLDPSLHTRIQTLLPAIVLALQSEYTIIRHAAAKCIATLCNVMTDVAMRAIVDDVVPLVSDNRVHARQGGVEAIYGELCNCTC